MKGLTNIFPEMDQLYIFRSDLKYLERSDFVSYTQLKTISLSRNHLSTNTIDFDTFEDLINLEYFSLSFNQLTAIPKLWTLVKLKELYLFENSIESLSVDDLANNKNLEFLWIYHNKLQFVEPQLFDSLTSLKFADFNNNKCINAQYRKWDLEKFRTDVKEKCTNKVTE